MHATWMIAAGLVFPLAFGRATAPLPVDQGFAVVELSTREGCSSCPPADDVLATLGGPRVSPLAFHVDDWDALGWPDPFGSALATTRQRPYAEGGRVYTPQMVVNGRRAFVGSDAEQARLAIVAAMAIPSTVHITLAGDRGQLRWRLVGTVKGLHAQLALVEGGFRSGCHAARMAAEHGGTSTWCAPSTACRCRGQEGAAELAVPADARKENLTMIMYLQDPKTRAIAAAVRL